MSHLNQEQREWIRKRDRGICQVCVNKAISPEIHHIIPYSVAIKVLGWSEVMANSPTNLVLVCHKPCHLMLHSQKEMSRYWQNHLGEIALHRTLSYVKQLGGK